MPQKNSSKYLLLGLIDWEPLSGYDIKKIVEQNIQDFWHESFGNIYPTLQRLLEQGLVEMRVERQEGRPDRNVYSITPKGTETLRSWLEQPTEERRTRDLFLVQFIFGYHLPVEALIDRVQKYQDRREERLRWYHEVEAELREHARDSKKALLEILAIRQGVLMTSARMQWCEEVLKELRAWPGADSSGE